MTNLTHGAAETLSTAMLLQHLHGENDAYDRAALEAHLADCDSCGAKLQALARSQQRISSVLAVSDFAPPDPGEWQRIRSELMSADSRHDVPSGPLSRYAPPASAMSFGASFRFAVVVMLVVTASLVLASPPVRAWIGQQWRALAGNRTAPAGAHVANSANDVAAIAFRPDAAHLIVAFDEAQAGGSLHVRFSDDSSARVVVSDGGTERLAVLQNGVSISNQADSHASYDVTLPYTTTLVIIHLGTADTLTLARADGADVTVDLSTGRVRNNGLRDDQ